LRAALAFLVLLAVTASRAPAWGQAEPPPPTRPPISPPTLAVTLSSDVPRVQAANILDDGTFVALMRDGFPLRLHYRLELWRRRARWFDQFVSDASWDVVVQQDPLTGDYILARSGGGNAVSRYAAVDQLRRALAASYEVRLAPRGTGEFYFIGTLVAETLNDSDIDQVMLWLKGELTPAVSGQGNVGEALSRGAQRLLVRLAGLPRVRLEARSEVFERR
jgi:uncharacterized protein DUF4390